MDQAESLLKMMENKSSKSRFGVKDDHSSSNNYRSKTRVITISSGKGGVGKTNFSISLALSFVSLGKKVVLMDGDLGLANVNVIFGIMPKYTLLNVMRKEKTIDEIIIDTSYGLKIIPGASGVSELANISDDNLEFFIRSISQIGNPDIVIIDTGAGISKNVLQFLLASEETIIITTPEPTSITDSYGIIKTIIAKKTDADIKLVVNRVLNENEGIRIADRIINIVRKFLNIDLLYLGSVLEDNAVRKSVLEQKPFYILDKKSKASKCIDKICNTLENRSFYRVGDDNGFSYFFNKLFKISKDKKLW